VEKQDCPHIECVTNEVTSYLNGLKAMKFLKMFRRRGYVWQPALEVQNGSSAAALMTFVGN
jgi:hypothetical protein